MTWQVPTNWYWKVNDSSPGTQVWQSSGGAFVGFANADYVNFLAAGNSPTVIDTAANLLITLDNYNRLLFNSGSNFGASSFSQAVDLQLTNPLSQANRVNMTAGGKKVILPQMNLPGSIAAGVVVRIVNTGANDFDLYLFGGASKVITVANATGGLGSAVDIVQVPGGTLATQSGNIAILDLYPEMQTVGTSHYVQLKAGGTAADLSGTGGTHQFLRQNSVGASVDVVQPGFTDLSGTVAASQLNGMSNISNTLSSDVALNNTGTFFTGPSIAQGTSGTWFVMGFVNLIDSSANAAMVVKLTDGTTDYAVVIQNTGGAGNDSVVTLCAIVTAPAGNLRIQAKDITSTNGTMLGTGGIVTKIMAIRVG